MDHDEFHGIFSQQRQMRLREMREFLDLIEDRIRSARFRLGDGAERAQKELTRLGGKVQEEISKLEQYFVSNQSDAAEP